MGSIIMTKRTLNLTRLICNRKICHQDEEFLLSKEISMHMWLRFDPHLGFPNFGVEPGTQHLVNTWELIELKSGQ